MVVSLLVLVLPVMFLSGAPAAANHNNFWPGFAVGVGSAFVLGNIFYPTRAYYSPPPRYYNPPVYYAPPPPREYWVPGHWEGRYGPYGIRGRVWFQGFWERY